MTPGTDPSVLLSTAAQAAAALVGIVGGFLVSRLVALSSERGSLVQRLKEVELRGELTAQHLNEVHAERLAVSTEWFIERNLERFLDERGASNIDDALDEFIPIGSSAEEMRPVAEELAGRITKAIARVTEAFPGNEPPSNRIEHIRTRIPDIPIEDERIYRHAAKLVAQDRGARVSFDTYPLRLTPDIVYSRQDARIESEEELRAEALALEKEATFLRTELRRFRLPEGVLSGIVVLSYFSLVGIVFPMVVMSIRPVPDNVGIRTASIATFGSGLFVLFAYIAWLVRRLRPSQETLIPPPEAP